MARPECSFEPIHIIDSSYFETPIAPETPEGMNSHYGIYRVDGGSRRFLPTLYKNPTEARKAEDAHVRQFVQDKLGIVEGDDFEQQVARERGNYRTIWLNEFDTYTIFGDKVLAHGVDDIYTHTDDDIFR